MGKFRRAAVASVVSLSASLLLVHLPVAQADNPIITDRFVADPSVHVFGDRAYVYATHDQANSGTYWDSKDWRAYSSDDLGTWTDHGRVFATTGFSWASGLAWAPAAAERDGTHYLYLPVDRDKIGVARSSSPAGGFSDARGTPLVSKSRDANVGDEPIDPMVFTDDDGRTYLYFGTRVPKVVQLNADMISTTGPIRDLQVSGGNYGEAPWLHKRGGVYYFSYSTGWPGQIAYATATSPLGPFTYRGIVLDYVNIDTNHQSIVRHRGEWYLAYHRNALPGGGQFKRSIAMDRLYYNSDGTMQRVEQTTSGVAAGGPETLAARHSGKVADVAGGSTADGAAVVQWPANGGTNQEWQFRDAGGDHLTVVNRRSGKCLDVAGNSVADDARVVQWTCGTGLNQQWRAVGAGEGRVRLIARHSGKCLDVDAAGTADGAALVQRTCAETRTSQRWLRTTT